MSGIESSTLRRAREHLARAEERFRTAEGLAQLEEGLALLDDVVAEGSNAPEQVISRNLASTYAGRLMGRIQALCDGDPGLPEPEMEHLFKWVIAFDEIDVALPDYASDLKLRLARGLIDRYYEGCSPAEREKALQQFAGIAGESRARRRGPR